MADDSNEDEVIVAETGLGRYQLEARAGRNAIFVDEPVAVGGLGTGLNPYKLLSAALGSCKVMTMRLYAQNKGWKVDGISVSVRHSRANLQARDSFQADIILKGELDESQRARLVEIAGRCPVHLTLSRGSDVGTSLLPPGASFGVTATNTSTHAECMEQACRS